MIREVCRRRRPSKSTRSKACSSTTRSAGGVRDRARPARRRRLRIRTPDGADEPASQPTLETVFLMPPAEWSHISSTLVREIAALGGSVDGLVPPAVALRLARQRDAGRTARRMSTDTLRSPTHAPDRAVADDEGDDRSRAAAPAGRGRRRSRRRRAGLPDARAHHRRRARGARQELHEVHGQHGHRSSCARRSARAISRTTA